MVLVLLAYGEWFHFLPSFPFSKQGKGRKKDYANVGNPGAPVTYLDVVH